MTYQLPRILFTFAVWSVEFFYANVTKSLKNVVADKEQTPVTKNTTNDKIIARCADLSDVQKD